VPTCRPASLLHYPLADAMTAKPTSLVTVSK
jgi:hypothetical protein